MDTKQSNIPPTEAEPHASTQIRGYVGVVLEFGDQRMILPQGAIPAVISLLSEFTEDAEVEG